MMEPTAFDKKFRKGSMRNTKQAFINKQITSIVTTYGSITIYNNRQRTTAQPTANIGDTHRHLQQCADSAMHQPPARRNKKLWHQCNDSAWTYWTTNKSDLRHHDAVMHRTTLLCRHKMKDSRMGDHWREWGGGGICIPTMSLSSVPCPAWQGTHINKDNVSHMSNH